MSEILRSIRAEEVETEGFDHAYRVAVVDSYCEMGDLKSACKWLWADKAAGEGAL